MADRKIVLIHGYSASGEAFNVWRDALVNAGWKREQLVTVSYESLTNEVSIRDIAEGFDRLLRQNLQLTEGEPFDAIVHSTGMLVLRSWLTRQGVADDRRKRLKHLIALAPATFGSPLAHKGRSFLGALVKGRKAFGPDFLEAGDMVLDALELGGSFGWDLAHRDLFSETEFYNDKRTTPYVFVFVGDRGYRGLSSIANESGTDGTVRWAGTALNSRKIVFDLTADCAEGNRVQLAKWTQDDVPMHPIANVDHGSILSEPPEPLVRMVVDALQVNSSATYATWLDDANAVTEATLAAMPRWQQFVVRAIDERGDGIRDWNLQLAFDDGKSLTPFTQDVHVYKGDASYRAFHVDLEQVEKMMTDPSAPVQLTAQLYASTGTKRVLYTGVFANRQEVEAPDNAGTWYGTLNLSTTLPGGATQLFHPFTTTFLELRLDRDPLTGPGMVIRLEEQT